MNGNQNKLRKVLPAPTKEHNTKGTMTKTLLGSMKGTKTKFEDALNEELDPPQCLNVKCVGHSFAPGSQVFIPMVKVSPSNKVQFPPCGVNESSY